MYTFPALTKNLNDFFSKYHVELSLSPSTKAPLKLPSERKCRFCGREGGHSFLNEAHLIPRLLGNETLLSDFECDPCNKHFSRIESHLTNYLGIQRTLWGLNNLQSSIPTFTSPDQLRASKERFYGAKSVGISRNIKVDSFKIDDNTGKIDIVFKKNSYVPLFVYKTLLKIALSAISQVDVENYSYAIKFLKTKELDSIVTGYAKVLCYTSPPHVRVRQPVATLFKRRNEYDPLPTHIFMLSFENIVYQFPIPFNAADRESGLFNQPVHPLFCPPVFSVQPDEEMRFGKEIINLSSLEKVVGEKDFLSFNANPEDLAKAIAFNPASGKQTNEVFDPNEIMKFFFLNENSKPAFPFNTDRQAPD
jgi:hypothetical protein